MSTCVAERKSALRRKLLSQRMTITDEQRAQWDDVIAARLIALSPFQEAKWLMVYLGFRNEVTTESIINRAFAEGKAVAVPRILRNNADIPGRMEACPLRSLGDVVPGSFGIREPIVDGSDCVIPPDRLDVIVIPGLAYTEGGERLGYGGGYYDRFLADTRPDAWLIGVAYDFQMVPAVPVERHDRRVHIVVTPTRTYIARVPDAQ